MAHNVYILRHTASIGNMASARRKRIPGYKALTDYVHRAICSPTLSNEITSGRWPCHEMISVAKEVRRVIGKVTGDLANEDFPLSNEGLSHLREIVHKLDQQLPPIDRVLCSPYRRTRETMQMILASCTCTNGSDVDFDRRLVEKRTGELRTDYPSYFVLNPSELIRAQKASKEILRECTEMHNPPSVQNCYYYAYCPPGGESSQDVIDRVKGLVQELAAEAGRTTLIVAHRVSILALVAALDNKLDAISYLTMDTPDSGINNGGLTHYRISEGASQRVLWNTLLAAEQPQD